jgi:hypothetical protein
MKTLVISFSGGRTSAYMAKYLKDKYNGKRTILTVFFNTGKEREETLIFVDQCDKEFELNVVWIEVDYANELGFKIVDFETASRNGEPFEMVIAKHGIPNMGFPHCTREMKTVPCNKLLKSMGITDYDLALGIRIDEPKRLKPKPNIIYPLAFELPMNKKQVIKWWSEQKFDLQLKGYEGNCDLCWKKSKRKLLTVLVEHPELANWWNEMEIKYGDYVPEKQVKRVTPLTFYRQRESMVELIEDSKMNFRKSTDDFTLAELMHSEPELDFTNGCEESCEAF